MQCRRLVDRYLGWRHLEFSREVKQLTSDSKIGSEINKVGR